MVGRSLWVRLQTVLLSLVVYRWCYDDLGNGSDDWTENDGSGLRFLSYQDFEKNTTDDIKRLKEKIK